MVSGTAASGVIVWQFAPCGLHLEVSTWQTTWAAPPRSVAFPSMVPLSPLLNSPST
jgi:hypothetical protein